MTHQRCSYDQINYLLPAMVRETYNYTLVLDLDETLVHFDSTVDQFRVRPYCRQFLAKMSNLFEIVIFTAACKDYADFIID